MSTVGSILTNIGALQSLNSISLTNSELNSTENELSTGLAITSPADNPAGSIEATGFTSSINGQEQAISDTNETVSLLQTAQGGISQQSDIAQKLYSLAVEAANGTETSADRSSLQSVANQLMTEMNNIAQTTQFNGTNLLDGSVTDLNMKTGATSSDNQILSIKSTMTSALGTTSPLNIRNFFTGGGNNAAFGSGSISFSTDMGGTGQIHVNSTTGLASIASQINKKSGQTGIIAKAKNSLIVNMGSTDSSGVNKGGVVFGFNISNAAGTIGSTGDVYTGSTASGLAAQINAANATKNVKLVASAINSKQIRLVQPSGLAMHFGVTPNAGNTLITASGNNMATYAGATSVGSLSLISSSNVKIGNSSLIHKGSVKQSPKSLDNINLTTSSGAQSAMLIIKRAINQLGQMGGTLGAVQQELTSDGNYLQNSVTNQTSALGVVQDANIPQVTNTLSEEEISAQSGVAALKASTQLQQSYVSLLP